jgi:hypothetical protein
MEYVETTSSDADSDEASPADIGVASAANATARFLLARTTSFDFAGTIWRRRLVLNGAALGGCPCIGGAPRGIRIDARGLYCCRECCGDTGGASQCKLRARVFS